MKYTENYHLPQWVKTDRIMMDDFNQMCADIEEGLTANAQAAADAAEKMPYVVGSYTGDGVTIRDITVGFRPSFVIICSNAQLIGSYSYVGHGMAMVGPISGFGRIILTDTGFRLDISDTLNEFPEVNKSNMRYDYIAFR